MRPRGVFKIMRSSFVEHEKYIRLCISLSLRVQWRFAETSHLRSLVATKFQKRISGPLLDRLDIHIEVPRVDFEKLSGDRVGESSEII